MTLTAGAALHVPPGLAPSPGAGTQGEGRALRDDDQLITGVVDSLIAAFPELPEPHIRACVQYVCSRFAHARVRTYLPILVERQARAALANSPLTIQGAPSG
jgi:hypothetical protein